MGGAGIDRVVGADGVGGVGGVDGVGCVGSAGDVRDVDISVRARAGKIAPSTNEMLVRARRVSAARAAVRSLAACALPRRVVECSFGCVLVIARAAPPHARRPRQPGMRLSIDVS